MSRFLLIDALGAIAAAVAWYLCFSRVNHRKGVQALRWVEAACSGQARVVQARWLNSWRVQAQLRFATRRFGHAQITVRLLPRPIPFHWLFSIFRRQKETLTFEADLDCVPGAPLEVVRHRWFTQGQTAVAAESREWSLSHPGPVVFTTRPQWTHELAPIINTFMTSRGHSLMSVRFRAESPHLAATVPLSSLADEDTAAGFLGVLKELAASASASR